MINFQQGRLLRPLKIYYLNAREDRNVLIQEKLSGDPINSMGEIDYMVENTGSIPVQDSLKNMHDSVKEKQDSSGLIGALKPR